MTVAFGESASLAGTFANQPAADPTRVGRLYAALDVGIMYRDNGSTWDEVARLSTAAHSHAESDITNLTDDLAGKAASEHTHTLTGKCLLFAARHTPMSHPAATSYHTPPGSPSYFGTHAGGSVPIPIAGTLRNLSIKAYETQPATGTLVATVIVNGSATAIEATIPANAPGATVVTDTTHTAPITALQSLSIRWVNNASTAVNVLFTFTLELDYSV